MMLYPPIDELVEKVGNEYALTNLVAKRAKELEKTIEQCATGCIIVYINSIDHAEDA